MTVQVRAKFWVKSIVHHHNGNPQSDQSGDVILVPVFGDENKPWSKFTPQGEIKMTITNPSALTAFELGKAYLVDFTPT